MTVQELIDKLSTIENKELIATLYDHEYGQWHDLKNVEAKTIMKYDWFNRKGETVLELNYEEKD